MNARRMSLSLAALLLAAATVPRTAAAATIRVTNCHDAGAGSLRAAAASATSGDTIDLRGLGCSRITLTDKIDLPDGDIALLGPGPLALTVSGNDTTRVLYHGAEGTVRIQGLSLAHGHFDAVVTNGVCLYSYGPVELRHVRVHHCYGRSSDGLEPDAYGAGVYSYEGLLLSYTSVFSNRLDADAGSVGGGVFTRGRLVMDHSHLHDNVAEWAGGGAGLGGVSLSYSSVTNNVGKHWTGSEWVGQYGGLLASGDVVVNKSTISGNESLECGGLCVTSYQNSSPGALLITDSTISCNVGTISAVDAGSVRIYNSTIVHNTEPGGTCAGAIRARDVLQLQSTIAAANTCGSVAGPDIGKFFDPSTRVTGSHNLINLSRSPLPIDTLNVNPRIAPLAWNGGLTRTHALLSDSPARDRGNNLLQHQYDQRGPGYPRTKGPRTDIGAYEY